ELDFNIIMYTAIEMTKPKTRREAVTDFLVVRTTQDWIDIREDILLKVMKKLDYVTVPTCFQFEYTIPRVQSTPLPLSDKSDYDHLLTLGKPGTKKNIKLVYTEKKEHPAITLPSEQVGDLGNMTESPQRALGTPKPPVKKSRAPRESDIPASEIRLAQVIDKLRDTWICKNVGCKSDHCYIDAEGGHFACSHSAFDVWGRAVLSGDATEKLPPNIAPFDVIHPSVLANKSPLLAARMKVNIDKAGKAAAVPSSTPMPRASTPPVPALIPTHAPNATDDNSVIPRGLGEGPWMTLDLFATYYLPDSPALVDRLKAEKITGTQAFRYMTVSHLREMGLVFGEIVDVWDAIERWAKS
ncbi:hypothetical protein FISHEDRAFT_49554, partial [Fistulina hepatica ATCC 64428]